jgi:hypothetical protein
MEACANYKPRPAPYHSLMQYFLTTKRDRSKVLSYYERMRSKGIQPTMHTYKLLIDTHATLEPLHMAEAETVLAEMRAAGEKPEAVHYAALIHAQGCVQQDMAGSTLSLRMRMSGSNLACTRLCSSLSLQTIKLLMPSLCSLTWRLAELR